jgi:hypothetical protein
MLHETEKPQAGSKRKAFHERFILLEKAVRLELNDIYGWRNFPRQEDVPSRANI